MSFSERCRTCSRSAAAAILLGLVVVACSSGEDRVCQDVGNCTHGGSNDWIEGCKEEAGLLRSEAAAAGCGALLDDYYACAAESFVCEGATARFPGCEATLRRADDCIAAATIKTSCAELAASTRACAGGSSASSNAGLPPACTTSRDCEARCFLDSVATVCAPAVDELSSFTTCAARCAP